MPGAARGGSSAGEGELGAMGDSRACGAGAALTRVQSRSVGGNQGQPRLQMARQAHGNEAGPRSSLSPVRVQINRHGHGCSTAAMELKLGTRMRASA